MYIYSFNSSVRVTKKSFSENDKCYFSYVYITCLYHMHCYIQTQRKALLKIHRLQFDIFDNNKTKACSLRTGTQPHKQSLQ